MEQMICISVLVFTVGLWLGVRLAVWKWKSNANEYMGIDGYKVFYIDFYDHKILSMYKGYLKRIARERD